MRSHRRKLRSALPEGSVQARLANYLSHLCLAEDDRARLLDAAGRCHDPERAFAELHRALSGAAPETPVAPALASVAERVRLAHPGAPLVPDRQGRPRLALTPPMLRTRMLPEPLPRNPFKRLLRGLRALYLGRRGAMAVRAPEPPSEAPDPRGHWHAVALFRRLLLLMLVSGQTALATSFMLAVLPYHGGHWLEVAILVGYAILFAWISASFWTALMGFWLLSTGWDRYVVSASAPADARIMPAARTAVLMPICNEDVGRVLAGLRATYDSVKRTGRLGLFDFYILSDTAEPDTRVAEVEGWLALCEQVNGFGRIFYRRRHLRIKRKSGNIADWCRRWGSRYRYMAILDADSVMSGATLVRLVQLMEANPGAGIIQTAPKAAGRETLYARIQQFATRVYGPLFTAGMHFWQLGESHYWGHNAIIRVAPFIRHCALGKLPGRGALAGEIMSHDFVEAALMRRGGWAVWVAYDLPGSYEEMPPTLLDELRRDQRWCQGNLQNFRLFLAQGLHPAHRAVFMTGVMAYLSAPLWFLFLALSTALLAVQTLVPPQYFLQPFQLFPIWPEWHPEWAIRLFSATLTLLFLPKILAAALLVFRGQMRFYGGLGKLLDSLLLEMLFSTLLAPIRMLFHTQYVLTALAGFAVRWKSPPREDAQTPWREALLRHGPGTLLGAAWAGGVYWLNPTFLWWLLPVAGSLVVAIPLSVWSSRGQLGRAFRRGRLFLIPEESYPPRELRWLRAALKRTRRPACGFRRAGADPVANAVMCAAGRPRLRLSAATDNERRRLVTRAAEKGPGALSQTDCNTLLTDPYALARLHFQVWANAAAHPAWNADAVSAVA